MHVTILGVRFLSYHRDGWAKRMDGVHVTGDLANFTCSRTLSVPFHAKCEDGLKSRIKEKASQFDHESVCTISSSGCSFAPAMYQQAFPQCLSTTYPNQQIPPLTQIRTYYGSIMEAFDNPTL